MARITTGENGGGRPASPVSLRSTRELVSATPRPVRPVRVTRPSPCILTCPTGSDVRGWLQLAADGDVEGAWRTILEHNPLPGICGRTCDRPCERVCNRSAFDEGVAVGAVERAIASEARRLNLRVERPAPSAAARHIAIIGAGPAGISCAYHLARRGHLPTMFDAMPEAGGRLRYGVPPFRVPRNTLDAELETLWQLGVGFQPGARFGADLTWEDLSAYAAVFIAIGANRPKQIAVPGAELSGVRSAWEFLRSAVTGQAGRGPDHVVVIGGGNTALDAARTARRMGAASVTVAYRRSRSDMPVQSEDLAQAESEGVAFLFQVTPVAFTGTKGRVTSISLVHTRAGLPDHSGRPRPEPIAGSEFVLPADQALLAIGGSADLEGFTAVVDADGDRIYADMWGRTTLPAIFAGGSAAQGPWTIANALGSGRRAAEAIDAWLAGREPGEAAPSERVGVEDLNLSSTQHSPRAQPARLDDRVAVRGMDEVILGLTWPEAMREAGRCLSCGSCTECDTCLAYCPEGAVRHDAHVRTYHVDHLHCKGCGICAAECPHGAIVLVAEAP